MTEDVVTVPTDTSLRACANRMLDSGVGSVVVTDDAVPVGIVTETDALRAGANANRPFSEIGVTQVMSRPIRHVAPGATVRRAIRLMDEYDVKKLPVVADMRVVGIVTMTDVVAHVDDIRKEAADLVRTNDKWHYGAIDDA